MNQMPKIIILAAGKGERIMPLTQNTPKPLLDLGHGKTLFEEQLENIKKSNVIGEVNLVIGYLADQVEAKMGFWRQNGTAINTVFNPFYENSNNLISLWLAKNHMDSDFIITNGDNLFNSEVFETLINNHQGREGIFLAVCKGEKYGADDMKVVVDSSGSLARVSKLIGGDQANGESVGLVLVAGQKYRELFKQNLEELARNKEYINKYWLEVFNLMVSKGIPVYTFLIDRSKWQEIDVHPDLENLRIKFRQNNQTS
jgi:choline kinase